MQKITPIHVISRVKKTMEGHKIKTKSKFKVRHQKHKLFRANDPLLSVLMWGVNFTVSYYFISIIQLIIIYLLRFMN
jgi:hypothetical protein